MIIHISPSGPLPVEGHLYLSKRPTDYTHVSKLRIKEGNPHIAELALLDSIDTEKIRLVDQEETSKGDFLPLDFRVGLTICGLSPEKQSVFWKEAEEQLQLFIKDQKFIHPEAARENMVVILPGTVFSHIEDTSYELYAYLTQDQHLQTVIGFISIYGFGGICGPDMVLLRDTP